MSESNDRYDLIVVGLGAMGSALAWQAQRRGLSVLGIDRHDPPHTFGSTHAETRVTRLAVGEGPQYLPFVARSHEIWREIEAETGERLLHQCGGLIVTEPVLAGARWNDFVAVTDEIARGAGIEYALVEPAQVRSAYPMYNVSDDVRVGYEPTAGLVMAERAVAAQIALARAHGATIRTNETVLTVEPDADGVRVTTSAGAARARHLVLSTGPWLPELAAPAHAALVTVTRQVVYWFEATDTERFSVDRIPFVMWVGETDEDYVSVFPTPPGGTVAVKVLGEQFLSATTPADVDRSVSPAEIAAFYERLVEPRIDGLTPRCVKAAVCLYTNTPDDHFLIDTDPRSDRVIVMSPCSGHGFKHSAALGEAVAELVERGTSTLDLSPFARRGAA